MDFKFDAFISYRRSDGGSFARRLRRRLLDYRLPRPFQIDSARPKLSLYLDTIYERATENFFEHTIQPALRASRHLIVVQTPSTLLPRTDGEPNWLIREIEYFRALPQGHEVSIALAKGDSAAPLPAGLRADFPNIEVVDFRQKRLLNPLKTEDPLLTFLAKLYDIPQERMPELRQEENHRRTRRILALLGLAVLLVLLLTGLLIWALSSRAAMRSALAVSDYRQAVTLAESDQPAAALGYLGRALRLDSESLSARSLAFDLLLRRNWSLPITALHHAGPITAAEFSPDGRRVLTASRDRTARLWDARTGESVGLAMRHRTPVSTAAFSPDGRRILTVAGDLVQIWNGRTGAAMGRPLQPGGTVTLAQFSPDGLHLLTASGTTARLWTADGRPLGIPMAHPSPILKADVHPDGWRIVTAAADDIARVWDARTGQIPGQTMEHGDTITAIGFSPDGRRVVTASEDFTAKIWAPLATGQPVTLKQATLVRSARFSPGATLLVTTAAVSPMYLDAGAQLWDAATGRQVGSSLSGGEEGVTARFSPDGGTLLTASAAGLVRLWDVQSGRTRGEPLIHSGAVTSARFSPEGRRVVTVVGSTAWVWDVQTGHAVNPTILMGDSVSAVQFSPDGACILTENSGTEVLSSSTRGIVATPLATASVFSAATGGALGRTMKHASGARFSSDGKLVLATEFAGPAYAWNALSGFPVGKPFNDPGFDRYEFSPDGRLLLGRSKDGKARVWDFVSQRPMGGFLRPQGMLSDVRFSPEGRRILTTSTDRSALLWDAETHRQIGDAIPHVSYEASSRSGWSSDGRWILTAPSEGILQVWDVDRGLPRGEPMHHPETLNGAIFSADGSRLITMSGVARTRVWDARSGRSIGEPIPAGATALSRDGERVVTTANDGTVQLWSASSGLRVAAAMGTDPRFSAVAKLSPDGERLVTAHGSRVQIWDVPVGRAQDAERLASLAEAVGGYMLTDLGTLIPVPDREARFAEFRRADSRLAADGSVMFAFLRWFVANRSTRAVSPLSRLSIPNYIRDRLGSKAEGARDEALQAFPDHSLLPHPVR